MADRRKELEQELNALQKEIEETLTEVRSEIDNWADVRYWIHRYPIHILGASLLFGFSVSLFTGRKKKDPSDSSEKGNNAFSSLFFSELKKHASKTAAKYIMKQVEENLNKKKKESVPEP